ncbi:2483_t:CDS:1, partial [Entrophospora sp. SA101]
GEEEEDDFKDNNFKEDVNDSEGDDDYQFLFRFILGFPSF